MGVIVVSGAQVCCPFGTVTAMLNVTSQSTIVAEDKPVATIQDITPVANISSFGMCTSLGNPQVASATAAALGVLTPQPCVPAITGTWTTMQTICLAEGKPCLTQEAMAQCSYGGSLTISNPGQTTLVI